MVTSQGSHIYNRGTLLGLFHDPAMLKADFMGGLAWGLTDLGFP